MQVLKNLAVAVLLTSFLGCGNPHSSVVSGTVKQGEQPLADAVVTFIPIEETPGLGGFGKTDADGKYTIVSTKGDSNIAPGEYKVTISRYLRKDGSLPDPNTPPIESDASETLPAIYSDRDTTTLRSTVSKEKNVHDFNLAN